MTVRVHTLIAFVLALGTSSHVAGAPLLGEDFPVLPDRDGTGGLWEIPFAVSTRTYDQSDFARLGFSSLAELLRWDGRLNVSSLYGPWIGDGLSIDGRSTRQCVLVFFNGHPLTTPQANLTTTLHSFSLSRLTRVEIVLGTSAGVYGPHGCEAVILLTDDGEDPGMKTDIQWRDVDGADSSFLIRRDVADLKMSAGVGFRVLGDQLDQWKSFRDAYAENFFQSDERLVGPFWSAAGDGAQTGQPEAPSGLGYSYDFYYRARIGDVGLSWNQSTYSSWAARGLDPKVVAYGDRFETETQESFYLTYVTDAHDGSWRFFWNISYAISEGTPSSSLISPVTAYESAYSYRDEHRLTLEEYIQWELSPWATLFSGGGAGFGTLTPRSALVSDEIEPDLPISLTETNSEPNLTLATQVSYRHLFGYGHLNLGDEDSVVLQLGGRFDSDTRQGLVISPRASLIVTTWNLADVRLTAEYSERPVDERFRYVGDRALGQDTILWTRPADIDLDGGMVLQFESSLEFEASTLSAYWRRDRAGPLLVFDPMGPSFIPVLDRRESVGWSAEKDWKYPNSSYFLGYRGWIQRIDDAAWNNGHRAFGRLSLSIHDTEFNSMVWAQYGDTVSDNRWSGGVIAGVMQNLHVWMPGLSAWARVHGGVDRRRESTANDVLLPLPRANIDGFRYSWSMGLRLNH